MSLQLLVPVLRVFAVTTAGVLQCRIPEEYAPLLSEIVAQTLQLGAGTPHMHSPTHLIHRSSRSARNASTGAAATAWCDQHRRMAD